ncbi:hypothetical protein HHI36_005689, partial [Cryptolaemus montrouzieri]
YFLNDYNYGGNNFLGVFLQQALAMLEEENGDNSDCPKLDILPGSELRAIEEVETNSYEDEDNIHLSDLQNG